MRNLSTKGATVIKFPAKFRVARRRSRQFRTVEANPDKSGLPKSSMMQSMIERAAPLRAWLQVVVLRGASALLWRSVER